MIFKILKNTFLAVAVAFILIVILRVFHFYNLDKTNAEVERIYNTRLTMADVTGENLPPEPGPDADKTIQGVDVNSNGIRDDVELAVFKEYPSSAKTRAILLQYALVLQTQMTLPIINTETVTATVEEKSKANVCLWNLGDSFEEKREFITKLQVNTEEREKYLKNIYEYLGSYSALSADCHIDISSLRN